MILGEVVEGTVAVDRQDPDRTKRRFQLDLESVRQGLVLREERSRMQRIYWKEYVKRHFRHHVKHVYFVDGARQASSEESDVLPADAR